MFDEIEDLEDQRRQQLITELEVYRRELEKLKAEVNQMTAGLTDEQFNWRPPSGGWSVGDCLAHLNVTSAQYLPPIDATIADARAKKRLGRGPFKHSWFGKYFMRSMEPPAKRKLRAPRVFAPDTKPKRPAVVVPAFLTFQEQLIDRVHAANGVDLGKSKVRSPAVSWLRLPLGVTFGVLVAHQRRHVWQAHQVMRDAGFPMG
ncbi:MAG: DinB family protein [Gemmatimonadota bacterium]|nr:DinB family protein [Gemmatimonadota bacterium]